ncbi:MAG: FeoB-associated Cys-rich membrane protein [Bacteroidales bacterium]|nr:FeoB-associated Cys-rich membrane protein [Candidatus Sodaliphilus fimicaballi]
MTQTIIALFIVALALLWVLMRLFKTPKKKGGSCSCGCSNCTKSECPTHPRH